MRLLPLAECHEFHVALPIPGSQRSYPSGSQRPARNQSTADTWCILFWAPFWVHFGLHCEFKWPRQSMTRKYTERKWYKPHIVASYYSTRMRQSGSCFVQPNPVRHTLIISHFNSTTLLPDRTSIQPLFNYLLPSHTSIQPHFNHSARTSTEPPFSQSSCCLTLQFNHTSIISHFNFSLTTLNHLTLLSSHTLVQAHFYHLTLKFNPTSIISSYLTLQLNPTSIISSHLTL